MNDEVSFWNSDHVRTIRHNYSVVETTGGFTSEGLTLEARTLILPSLTQAEAIEIGEIAKSIGLTGVEIIAEFLARKGELS